MSSIAILVLAAGKSSRMKTTKQLLKFNNKFLLDVVLEKSKKLCSDSIFCVLGANSEKIKKNITTKNVHFIINKNYDKGLSTSIVEGVRFIESKHKNLTGILILLADQPKISSQYLRDLIQLFTIHSKKIVASKYNNSIGVPAIFPSSYFSELKCLKGDLGAKKLLKKEINSIIFSNIDTNFVDLDTPEDLHNYKTKHNNC